MGKHNRPATREGRNEINERYAIPRRTAPEAERENRESSYGSAGSMSRGGGREIKAAFTLYDAFWLRF